MIARITPAQARALGISPVAGSPSAGRKVKRRAVAKGVAFHTECLTCGTEFHTEASEDRHVNETRHARYRLIPGH